MDHFKYLGTIASEKNNIIKEVAARIHAENMAFYNLAKLLSTK